MMSHFLEWINDLPMGHIYDVTILTILGIAALVAARRWRESRSRAGIRLIVAAGGAFMLAIARFGLDILAARQGLEMSVIAPEFDGAVSTLAIMLFAWSLIFPTPARKSDAITAGLVTLTLVAYGMGWDSWLAEVIHVNGFHASPWALAQITLLVSSILLVLVRRRSAWLPGMGIFTFLLLGSLTPNLLLLPEQDFRSEIEGLAGLLGSVFWLFAVRRRAARPAAPDTKSAGSPFRMLWPFVRPYWRGFLVPVIAITASSGVSLLKPWPFKFLIDNVLKENGPGQGPLAVVPMIAVIAGSIVAIAVLQGLLSYSKEVFLSSLGQRVAFALRSALFAHIQRLPLAFHDRQRTGDLITRVTSDVTKVQELVTDGLLVGGATNILQLAGMLVVMLVIDWKLGLIATLSAPMLLLTTWYFRRRIRTEEQHVRRREGDITSLAQETISSIRVVKAFGRERFEAERFEEQSEAMLEAGLRVTRLEARFSWVLNIVTALSLAAIVGFGAYEVLSGVLSVGTLVVFVQYMHDLQSPLTSLSRLSAKMAKATVRAERLAEVLNEAPTAQEFPGSRTAPRFQGRIQLDQVSFRYSAEDYVLRDINLTIEPGESIAVVGATGAGKSTLVGLILRLYDPSEGVVRVDGHDVREYTLDSFVDQISVVLQESLLFRTTIRENIAYGRPSATFKEIQNAASLAYCDEFISKLPKGFDTIIGERGTTLSGGQRQRIAIARALIRDAPILILDEPTTGLDPESEAIVLEAVERLMRGRTTIMITHKPVSAGRADRIFVLDRGRLVAAGTHDELNAPGGAYARILQLNSQG